MEFKKSMFIVIMAIFLISIAGVCAADANDTTVASEDNLEIDKTTDDVIGAVEDTSPTSNGEDEILSEGEQTFTQLNATINGNDDNDIYLNGSYMYSEGDGSFKDGIVISREVNIHGNGAIIDAQGKARVFNVQASDVTINNLTIKNANYDGRGGAIYFRQLGSVINCNFTHDSASHGGALFFEAGGTLSYCNFADNAASNGYGGAVYFEGDGIVSNCNFTNNAMSRGYGGAIYFYGSGDVTNCSFAENEVYMGRGGAIYMRRTGSATTCNFIANSASNGDGGAVYSYLSTVADTCIFKTSSDTAYSSNGIQHYPPTFGAGDFMAAYGSGERLEFDLRTHSGMQVDNANISIVAYHAGNASLAGCFTCLSGEGWAVDLPVGSYYAVFSTEYPEVDSLTRTVKVLPDVQFYVNVTPASANSMTVNITAESNVPNDIVEGRLLFILPGDDEINASYGAGGIWWAVYEFDDYGNYNIGASYIGLEGVSITNATISIVRANSTVHIEDVFLDYGDSVTLAATTEGATGITAEIDANHVSVIGGCMIPVSGLDAGSHALAVTTIPDRDHVSVTRTASITVRKVDSTLTLGDIAFDYMASGISEFYIAGATGITASVISQPEAVVTVSESTITVSGLDSGVHILSATTLPDKNHNPVTKTVTVIVNKLKTRLTADAVNATYKGDEDLMIALKDSLGNPLANRMILVDLNGVKILITDSNGQVRVSTNDLAAGDYAARAIFLGSDNYAESDCGATVTVARESTSLYGDAVTTTYNVNRDLVITLKDSHGNPIKGCSLTVDLNGVKAFTTDANGQIRVATGSLTPKSYGATVTFAGNANYAGSAKSVKVTVTKAASKLGANAKTFKKSLKTKKYSVTLKDNRNRAIGNAELTIKVKGKTFKAKTNAKGVATFNIKKLSKKGKYDATITYNGDSRYTKATKKVKIIVK